MPQEMPVRRTFLRLLGSLRNLRNYLLRKRGPNMSLLAATLGLFFSEGSFSNFSNSLIILETSFLPAFPMAYLAFLYFYSLTLALKPREVINPFPDLSYFPFDSEDLIFILSRLSNFDEMSKVTYLSLPLISLCYLTL